MEKRENERDDVIIIFFLKKFGKQIEFSHLPHIGTLKPRLYILFMHVVKPRLHTLFQLF